MVPTFSSKSDRSATTVSTRSWCAGGEGISARVVVAATKASLGAVRRDWLRRAEAVCAPARGGVELACCRCNRRTVYACARLGIAEVHAELLRGQGRRLAALPSRGSRGDGGRRHTSARAGGRVGRIAMGLVARTSRVDRGLRAPVRTDARPFALRLGAPPGAPSGSNVALGSREALAAAGLFGYGSGPPWRRQGASLLVMGNGCG